MGWAPAELDRIGAARELGIAVRGTDGALRRSVPVWVVCAGADVYVRTWYRRDTGWYGRILRTRRARVVAGDVQADVDVEDVGDADREAVDAAYRTKYGAGGSVDAMVNDAAAATTLRLSRTADPEEASPPDRFPGARALKSCSLF